MLSSGWDLLLEKPATLCLSELKELIQIAEKKDLCFVCSLHAAFDNTVNWILDEANIAYLSKMYGWTNKITKINCEFFDPYLYDGTTPLKNRFESLHDSWVDSGINALSVISNFVKTEISHIGSDFKISQDPNYPETIVDAKVEYSFNETGKIFIHTSWCENVNRKCTSLTDDKNNEITLFHTGQKITIVNNEKTITSTRELEDKNRLENQYINLYKDFYKHLANRTDNLVAALKLHELLFKATEVKH